MRKLIAIIFSIILVFPLLLSAQAAVSVTSWALDKQFYIDALDQPEVYEAITSGPMIDELLHKRLGIPVETDTSELESALKGIITREYMREQMGGIINALFDYLQGKTDTFEPALNIASLKNALEDDQQDAFLNALVAALPTCSPGQVSGIGGGGRIPCKPDSVSDDHLTEQVLKPAMPGILSAIPDEIPLEGEFLKWQEEARWRRYFPGMAVPASIILSLLVLVFIAASIWYLTALISDSSWRVRLQWLGWTLIIPAALIFLLGFAVQSGMPVYWIEYGLEHADLVGTLLGSLLDEAPHIIAAAALPRIANAFQMVGGICGGLSLAFIFWGIASPREKLKEV